MDSVVDAHNLQPAKLAAIPATRSMQFSCYLHRPLVFDTSSFTTVCFFSVNYVGLSLSVIECCHNVIILLYFSLLRNWN